MQSTSLDDWINFNFIEMLLYTKNTMQDLLMTSYVLSSVRFEKKKICIYKLHKVEENIKFLHLPENSRLID